MHNVCSHCIAFVMMASHRPHCSRTGMSHPGPDPIGVSCGAGDSSAVVVAVADSADVSPGELEASLRARGEAFQSDITLDRPQ